MAVHTATGIHDTHKVANLIKAKFATSHIVAAIIHSWTTAKVMTSFDTVMAIVVVATSKVNNNLDQ